MIAVQIVKLCTFLLVLHSLNGINLDRFKENTQIDGKMCLDSDVVFRSVLSSLARCACQCGATIGCLGFMYNSGLPKCVGCRGQYTDETALANELGTRYFGGDWLGFGGKLYKLSQTKMTFTQAVEYCRVNGGLVARIDNDDKTQFVAEVLLSPSSFWISLTDEGHEGTWTWMNDNSVTNYTNWYVDIAGTEPDGGSSVNCVVSVLGYTFRWSDRNCLQKLFGTV